MISDHAVTHGITTLDHLPDYKLPVTYVICNNRSYRILKERLVSMRGAEKHVGMDLRDPPVEWVGLAQSLGVQARRVTDAADIAPAIKAATARGGPSLIDAAVQDGFGD